MVQGIWDLAEGSGYVIDLPSFLSILGLGLALGFGGGVGGGGGVASERARVWWVPDRLHPRPDSAQMCESDTEDG